VPSAKRQRIAPRLLVGVCAGALLLGGLAGCETTQEKAAKHQAESQRILDARAKRQAAKKKAKHKDGEGEKSSQNGGKKQ
jgi:hypothetical protein